MRKQNEGYVLPLVLVVMIVMSLIAVGVMSVSLRNLQTQKADIARMQDQYAAQGELEKKIAVLNALSHSETYGSFEGDNGAQKKAKEIVESILGVSIDPANWSSDGNSFHCTATLSTSAKDTKITCTILLGNLIVKDMEQYKICAPNVVYLSYEIGGADNG